ncbi:MAG TPA: Na+/H+ antiporter subunit E [Aggregatilineales bacterium]|nr:Na+/H+ antiporter subunit E [Aggregatilineales bacterium]
MNRQAHLLVAFSIFVGWLALAPAITPGQVILAGLVAAGGAWMMARLRLPRVSLRKPRAMVQLALRVSADIIRSNIAVARIIFGRAAKRRANFLIIPLEMKSRAGLAVLAGIITATPGTIWVSYDGVSNRLLLHILDLIDEKEWLDTIQNRYERMLMEIFE